MKSILISTVAALVISGGAAYAQSINIGPGGVDIDTRTPRERAVDREIRREERRDRWERRQEWRAQRASERCRVMVTREETPRGTVRRETRVCD